MLDLQDLQGLTKTHSEVTNAGGNNNFGLYQKISQDLMDR